MSPTPTPEVDVPDSAVQEAPPPGKGESPPAGEPASGGGVTGGATPGGPPTSSRWRWLLPAGALLLVAVVLASLLTDGDEPGDVAGATSTTAGTSPTRATPSSTTATTQSERATTTETTRPPPEVRGDVATADPDLLGPGTLWVGTFDNPGDWKDTFGIEFFGNSENATVARYIKDADGDVLRVETPGSRDQSSRDGIGFHSSFDSLGIGGQEEIYFRYRMFIPKNFDWVEGGKLPGLAGVSDGTPIRDVGSGGEYTEDGWSGRLLFQEDHGVSTYLYVKRVGRTDIEDHREGGQLYGFSERFRNPDGTNMTLREGWNTIELYYKLNTPGQNDGVFRGWINGRLGRSETQVEYRSESRPDLDINQIYFSHFYGGPKGPKKTQYAYFDDLVLSRSRSN